MRYPMHWEDIKPGKALCDMHDYFKHLPENLTPIHHSQLRYEDGHAVIEHALAQLGVTITYFNKTLQVLNRQAFLGDRTGEPIEGHIFAAYSYDALSLGFVVLDYKKPTQDAPGASQSHAEVSNASNPQNQSKEAEKAIQEPPAAMVDFFYHLGRDELALGKINRLLENAEHATLADTYSDKSLQTWAFIASARLLKTQEST